MFENGPNDQLLDARRGQSLEFLRPYFLPIAAATTGSLDAPLLSQHNPKLGVAFARFLAWYFLQLSPVIRLPAARRTLANKLSNANVKPIPSLVLLVDLSRQLVELQSRAGAACASEFATGAPRPDAQCTPWLASAIPSTGTSTDSSAELLVYRETLAESMRLTQLDPQYCFDLLVHCQLLDEAALFALLNSNPLSSLVLDATIHVADALLESTCQKLLQRRLEKLAAKASVSHSTRTLAQCALSGPNVLLALCVQQVEQAVATSVAALDQSSDCHRQLVGVLRAFARLANALFALDLFYFLAFYLSARLCAESTRLLQRCGPLVAAAVYLPQPPLFCPQAAAAAAAHSRPPPLPPPPLPPVLLTATCIAPPPPPPARAPGARVRVRVRVRRRESSRHARECTRCSTCSSSCCSSIAPTSRASPPSSALCWPTSTRTPAGADSRTSPVCLSCRSGGPPRSRTRSLPVAVEWQWPERRERKRLDAGHVLGSFRVEEPLRVAVPDGRREELVDVRLSPEFALFFCCRQ